MTPKKSSSSRTKEVKKKTSPVLYASAASAGFPAPGDDLVEKVLDIGTYMVRNPAATFFVRVAGDSMKGVHITTGDILVVDRSVSPTSGAIVVAAVFGELVVKRIKKKGVALLLVSENEEYEPIRVEDEGDCVIWGVVTGIVRKYA